MYKVETKKQNQIESPKLEILTHSKIDSIPTLNQLLNQTKPVLQNKDSKKKRRIKKITIFKRYWRKAKKFFSPFFTIAMRLLGLRISLKPLWFLRVPLILTSEVTAEHFIERFLHWLGISEAGLIILLVMLRIALVIVFLVMIRDEIKLISSAMKEYFGIEKKATSVFLLIVFTVIAVITVFF